MTNGQCNFPVIYPFRMMLKSSAQANIILKGEDNCAESILLFYMNRPYLSAFNKGQFRLYGNTEKISKGE